MNDKSQLFPFQDTSLLYSSEKVVMDPPLSSLPSLSMSPPPSVDALTSSFSSSSSCGGSSSVKNNNVIKTTNSFESLNEDDEKKKNTIAENTLAENTLAFVNNEEDEEWEKVISDELCHIFREMKDTGGGQNGNGETKTKQYSKL